MGLPAIYVVRHGETSWSAIGRHTSVTDLPLTERGRTNAQHVAERLRGLTFTNVLTSPLRRAVQTCAQAGFESQATIDRDLVEWNYGDYEGRTSEEILADRPNWELFRDGCPGGESPDQVAARADRVLNQVRNIDSNVLIFSSGHFLRMLATRWIGLAPIHGGSLMLDAASVSILTHEHAARPAIQLWNDTRHLCYDASPESDSRS